MRFTSIRSKSFEGRTLWYRVCLIAGVAVLLALLLSGTVWAETLTVHVQDQYGIDIAGIEEFPVIDEGLQMPGRVEGTGTHFEITDSEYLNITLESTEEIHLTLESVPEMVTMHIEAASSAASTLITLSGFPPSTTYYKYEDDYHNLEVFTTDESGSYSYVQDISTPHSVFIQPRQGTRFIPSDTEIGTWDPDTRTYTLTTDVSETIQIDEDDLTLDGAGYTITGSGSGYGVYLSGRTGVTIENLNVKRFFGGIWLSYSSNNTLTNNTASDNYYGIYLRYSSNNTLTGNTVSDNRVGIHFYKSNHNTLTGNTATLNDSNGFYLHDSSGNTLINNTASNHRLFGIRLFDSSNNNTLTGNTASDNYYGIRLYESSNNTLTDNTASSNTYGIWLSYSSNNQIYNNNSINNSTQALVEGGSGNVFNLDEPVGGNYWSDWTGPDDDGDGFVDNPYVFTGGQDNLPWVNQDGWKKNKPPVANAGLDQVGNEGSPITFDASGSSDPDDDPLHYRWDFDNDGIWDTEWLTSPTVTHAWFDDWSGTVKLEVSDGELTDTDTATVTINNVAPTVGAITAPLDPVQVNTEISASAEFTDPGALDTHTAVWDWGDGSDPTVIEITDGSRSVSGSHTYSTPGVYTVELTVTDKDGGSGESVFQYVVVYDPEGGFVTGGGWIDSPAGAYTPDPSLTGKSNFGFVSKYKKGASVPTGQTEFQFRVADLNFHSDAYDWLVVAGPKAQFKGSGTINGAGNYGFMLTAIDAALTPSTEVDKFRIKIWDKDDGDKVIYDNQMEAGDDADPTTAIGGGSIVIHKG